VKIEVEVGDLLAAHVEAIVNAANSELWMGGGVAGAIKKAAGKSVESEAMALGPIKPGQSVVTSAGALKAPIRWVVHAATMGPDLVTSEDYIRRSTASSMICADSVGAKSIAFPALGTGVGGFPVDRAAQVMIGAVIDTPVESSVERVLFVVRDERARHAFEGALRAVS